MSTKIEEEKMNASAMHKKHVYLLNRSSFLSDEASENVHSSAPSYE